MNMHENTNVNIDQTTKHLIRMFENICDKSKIKQDKLKELQTEFAYLLYEIANCAPCLLTKSISNANVFIKNIEELNNSGG